MNASFGEDLTTTALLGTARRPVTLDGLAGRVGDLARTAPATDPAEQLLHAAAVTATARRAGTRPLRPAALPNPAPSDTVAPVPPAAASRLATLLPAPGTTTTHPLLLTWLSAAADGGYRAPDAHLPALLNLAASTGTPTQLRTAILAVLGERGRWLAGHRPDWRARVHQSATPDTGDVWDSGTLSERIAHLATVRATEPDQARTMLEAVWKREPAEHRAALLDVLRHALSGADEGLLGRAVTDRVLAVRQVAIRLLSLLPTAGFTQAVTARATAAVRVERRLLRRTIHITWPEPEPTDPFSPAPRGTGERAWLLEHLIAATPLTVWPAHLGAGPDDLAGMPVADDAGPTLHRGWVRAAVDQNDRTWARALLQVHRFNASLIARLPQGERAAHLADLVRADTGTRTGPQATLAGLLGAAPAPWPDQLADAIISWARTSRAQDWNAAAVLDRTAERAAPTATVEARLRAAAQDLPPDDPWRRAIHRAADTVHTRRQILEELT